MEELLDYIAGEKKPEGDLFPYVDLLYNIFRLTIKNIVYFLIFIITRLVIIE